ncbi:unnamed protein product, partial [Prorocentrum cordatum]
GRRDVRGAAPRGALVLQRLRPAALVLGGRDRARLPPQGAERSEVLLALLPLLDELVRRELLILGAERRGDLAEARRLRDDRSARHRARDEWVAACAAEGAASPTARRLYERFETLTEARADVTADEGSYPQGLGP